MALIGTIRKNFWFVLILLGLALAAFILMDMTSAPSLGGAAPGQMTMGEVNGEKIDYREFQVTENVLFNGAGDVFEKRNSLWNYMIDKAIVSQESKALGMGVSEQEIMDLEFGTNMSPIIQQNWRNPNTGQIDVAQLQQIKNQIETGVDMEDNLRQFWIEQRKQIITTHLQDKLNNITTKAMYTPTWMAEMTHAEQNATVDFEFVKIPFSQINDPSITVTDDDYKSYINSHAASYTNDEESRALDLAVFNVYPTAADSSLWKTEVTELAKEFRNTTNDSLFLVSKESRYQDFYFSLDQLATSSPVINELAPTFEIGQVSEAFIENGRYNTFKVIDRRVVPDSVTARHILKNAVQGNALSMANAEKVIDSLMTVLNNRTGNFADLAASFSDDTASKADGGEMKNFAQGAMVPQFNAVCFYDGKPGNLYKVKTQYGVHLVEILNQKFNTRDPKYKIGVVGVPIIPSKETQDAAYEEVAELIGANPYWDALSGELGNKPHVETDIVRNLKQNDYTLSTLGGGSTSRDIIKWAFESGTDINDVAPNVFTYTDEINYYNNKYVVASLKSTSPAGLMSVDDARSSLEFLVLNEKKGQFLANKIGSSDISSVASQNNSSVETTSGVSFGSTSVPVLGNEPKVVAQAFNTAIGQSSQAIIGNEGVYVVKPTNKTEATAAPNIVTLRSLNTTTSRTSAGFKLFEGLRKAAKVEDKRFTFF